MPKKTTAKKDTGYAVKRSSAGLGLFATRPYAKGEFVIEYVGPILTDKEADKKEGKYLFEVGPNKTIDGSVRTNTARYINSSCDPNCEAINERGRIKIYAMRPIAAGEEFSYDYGKEYFEEFLSNGRCKCPPCTK